MRSRVGRSGSSASMLKKVPQRARGLLSAVSAWSGWTAPTWAAAWRAAAIADMPWAPLVCTRAWPRRAMPLLVMVAATRVMAASGTVRKVTSAARAALIGVSTCRAPTASASSAAWAGVRLATATTSYPASCAARASARPARPAPTKASVGRLLSRRSPGTTALFTVSVTS